MNATRNQISTGSGGVRLDQLFANATVTGGGGVEATTCTCDLTQVQPGDVFVALPELATQEENGHLAVQEAVRRGARAIVCEEPVPVFDVPTYLVPDTRVAWGVLCQAVSSFPAKSIPVIAVTGTHGKSTVIALLDSIFSLAGKHCGKISSLDCYDGMSHFAGIQSPSAAELATRLERMVAAGCTHALTEVSSEALSDRSFAGVEFDVVCITNVSEAHLDLHNSVQSYRRLKRQVLEHLTPTGVAILNADDPVSIKWLAQVDGPVLTFGTKCQAEITADRVSEYSNEQIFMLSAGNHTAAVRTTMVGEHHVANCLAAATIALASGIDLQTIAAGIQAVETLPGRMQRIDCGQGYPVFVDAADTAESLRASLRAARHLSTGRVICVLGDPRSATYSEQLAIAHVVNRMADLAFTSRPFPAEEMDYWPVQDSAVVEIVADRRTAIAKALESAQDGDVVVVAGSCWEPQRTYGSLGTPHENGDAATAKRLLYARLDSPRFRLVA